MMISEHTFYVHHMALNNRFSEVKIYGEKVTEKSRECHNHTPQPFPYTKRKKKQTKPNKRKSNKGTTSAKISFLFPKRGNRYAQRTEKAQERNNTRQDLKQIASWK